MANSSSAPARAPAPAAPHAGKKKLMVSGTISGITWSMELTNYIYGWAAFGRLGCYGGMCFFFVTFRLRRQFVMMYVVVGDRKVLIWANDFYRGCTDNMTSIRRHVLCPKVPQWDFPLLRNTDISETVRVLAIVKIRRNSDRIPMWID